MVGGLLRSERTVSSLRLILDRHILGPFTRETKQNTPMGSIIGLSTRSKSTFTKSFNLPQRQLN